MSIFSPDRLWLVLEYFLRLEGGESLEKIFDKSKFTGLLALTIIFKSSCLQDIWRPSGPPEENRRPSGPSIAVRSFSCPYIANICPSGPSAASTRLSGSFIAFRKSLCPFMENIRPSGPLYRL